MRAHACMCSHVFVCAHMHACVLSLYSSTAWGKWSEYLVLPMKAIISRLDLSACGCTHLNSIHIKNGIRVGSNCCKVHQKERQIE